MSYVLVHFLMEAVQRHYCSFEPIYFMSILLIYWITGTCIWFVLGFVFSILVFHSFCCCCFFRREGNFVLFLPLKLEMDSHFLSNKEKIQTFCVSYERQKYTDSLLIKQNIQHVFKSHEVIEIVFWMVVCQDNLYQKPYTIPISTTQGHEMEVILWCLVLLYIKFSKR